MIKITFTIAFFVLNFTIVFSQQKAELFSVEIKKHYKKFVNSSNIAYENGDVEKGQKLYDSLVKNYLVGTKIEDYTFKRVNGRKVKLNKLDKPVMIITYASWCVMNKAEIPAMNKIATKYKNDFDLIVLFWDKKSNIKKLANKFNNDVLVCYANESYLSDEDIVATLKHYLGFPTSYFINEKMEVVDIQRGSFQLPYKTPLKKGIEMNMAYFQKRITKFLLEKNVNSDPYVKSEQ
jgi:thiol-disulfide isomerase/thioredoxin